MNDEKPYSNREIRQKWEEVSATLKEMKESQAISHAEMKDTQKETLAQVKYTNGRVTELEKWKFFISGGMTVITVIVLPLLGWALYTLSNIDTQIDNGIKSALSSYDIEIK